MITALTATTKPRRGSEVMPSTYAILRLHDEGLCSQEIAARVPCKIKQVWNTLERHKKRPHPNPLSTVGNSGGRPWSAARREKFLHADTPIDELVRSGEPDRRLLCYTLFGQGATNELAMIQSGASLKEVQRFRRQRPANWDEMYDFGEGPIQLDEETE